MISGNWFAPIADFSLLDRLDFTCDDPALDASDGGDDPRLSARLGLGPGDSFWSRDVGVRELIGQQRMKPLRRIGDLKSSIWPDDESVDEFITTIRRWRSEGG